MGSRIATIASSDERFDVRALVAREQTTGAERSVTVASSGVDGRNGGIARGFENAQNAAENAGFCDVLIDFSSPEAVHDSIALAERLNSAMVVGTTGLKDEHVAALKGASRRRAVLLAPNTSLGVCVTASLARAAAKALGSEYECSIVEAHHSKKKDAPSGTALRLARAVREAGHELRDDQVVAIRGGDVVGEHTVRFAGPGEYLEITHRATTRDLFARGALVCAAWLKGRVPGWYTVEDVVGMPA